MLFIIILNCIIIKLKAIFTILHLFILMYAYFSLTFIMNFINLISEYNLVAILYTTMLFSLQGSTIHYNSFRPDFP